MPSSRSRYTGALALLLGAAPGASAQVGLTMFNDGRVLVRRTVPADLKQGQSEVSVAIGQVDPATVFSLDSSVTILGSRYEGGVDEGSVVRRAVGRRITFLSGRDTVRAELVGVDPERYKLTDGSVVFGRPGTALWPADLVITNPTLSLNVSTSKPRRALPLGYFTMSGGWEASYHLLMGAKGLASVSGQAVLRAGPLKVKEASVQLLAGDPGRAMPQAPPQAYGDMMVARANMAKESGVGEATVGDVHIYSLPGRVTIEPGVVTTVQLFPPATAGITKTYEAPSANPYYGPLPQFGEPMESPIGITYTVRRPRKSDFGDRPMPAGTVRLYESDSAGQAQLIGEASAGHTAAGEDLRVSAGVAFDLGATRVQTTYTTGRDTTGGRKRTVATADYRVTLTNARSEPVAVDVLEERGGEWSVVSSSVPAEKLSSTRTRFRVTVPAGGEAILTYRLRVLW
ncbi:MAG: hypothetical protein OEW17_03315 [Gemmatimonadota bacterium]|nr:hypothetical protein [Gemmatimonadota bacterium]MDH4347809.1 hypothetical protein [Gemmatimonadota bacterium]MDH5282378.1 hypothetical protein [Gemmatimonadota bacterium]